MSLDPDVLQLLEDYINSHAKLVIMRCMHDLGHVQRAVLVAAAPIDQGHETTDVLLAELVADRLLDIAGDGALDLGEVAREPAFAKLMRTYETDIVAILSHLSTLAMERMRKMTASAYLEQLVRKAGRKND